mmetsp:Transcript_119095/g.193740  ORF Transcript_119095/g.193740 Transcript_119095/m.193740 type:complete len:185 (+) Transcript_119095:1-555(+)
MGLTSATGDALTQSQTSVNSYHYPLGYTSGPQTPRATSPARAGSPVARHRVNSVVHRMTSAPDGLSQRMRSSSPDVERYRVTGTPSGSHTVLSAAISGSTTPANPYRQEAIYVPASAGSASVSTPGSPGPTARFQVPPPASSFRVGHMERMGHVERFYSAPTSGPVSSFRVSGAVSNGLSQLQR